MIQPAKINGRGLVRSNTRLLTNNTLLGSNTSRSVNIGNQRKNFSSSAPVTADNNRRKSVDSTTSTSSYNGSNPELLYDRSDKLQERAVNLSISKKNFESYKELAIKYETNPASITTDERVSLEKLKKQMIEYDKSKSVTENIDYEVNKHSEIISHIEEKHIAKQNKANSIVENSMNPVSPNKPTDNQTPTEFVHELESISPMPIIPDDD